MQSKDSAAVLKLGVCCQAVCFGGPQVTCDVNVDTHSLMRFVRWPCSQCGSSAGRVVASSEVRSQCRRCEQGPASAASLLAQVHTKLLAQWRNLQDAKQGTFKHWLYRCPAPPPRPPLPAGACLPAACAEARVSRRPSLPCKARGG